LCFQSTLSRSPSSSVSVPCSFVFPLLVLFLRGLLCLL
jgi:hypothetical protein